MGSLGRTEVVGALERLEELLGQVCGGRLERTETQPSLTLYIPWGMAEGYTFGRMYGVVMRLYAFFPLSVLVGSQ